MWEKNPLLLFNLNFKLLRFIMYLTACYCCAGKCQHSILVLSDLSMPETRSGNTGTTACKHTEALLASAPHVTAIGHAPFLGLGLDAPSGELFPSERETQIFTTRIFQRIVNTLCAPQIIHHHTKLCMTMHLILPIRGRILKVEITTFRKVCYVYIYQNLKSWKITKWPYKSIELNQIYIIFNQLYVFLLILHIKLPQIIIKLLIIKMKTFSPL